MTDKTELIDLEHARCSAIAAGDKAQLNAMLAEDYLHVYGSGLSSGKDEWIEHVTEVPRFPEHEDIKVRIYGDTAVLTGIMINKIRPDADAKPAEEIGNRVPVKEDIKTFATQVVVRDGGAWKFVSFQLTRCVD